MIHRLGTWSLVTGLFLLMTACASHPQRPSAASGSHPNVLLILVDDLGYGDLGSYNPNSKIPTPAIDSLAADGMRFSDAHAAGSVCKPSRFGLMTGQHPIHMTRPYEAGLIAPGTETIASVFRQAGYATSAVGKWHLGMVDEKSPTLNRDLKSGPLDHGFDRFFGLPASLDVPPYYYIRDRRAVEVPSQPIAASPGTPRRIQGAFYRAGQKAPHFEHARVIDELTRQATAEIEFLSNDQKRPFFLYFALPSPHTPWLPSASATGQSAAGAYGDYVVETDRAIGQVLAALDREGLTKSTLVIFTSDNGPVWFSSDRAAYDHNSTGPLSGMKGDVAEGGHRIPFIAKWPGQIKAGRVQPGLISLLDTLATVAEIIGVTLSENPNRDSFSYRPLLFGEKSVGRKQIIHVSSGVTPVYALRSGDWKWIAGKGLGGFSDRFNPEAVARNPHDGHLYNLKQDLGEKHNLYTDHPGTRAALASKLNNALIMSGVAE